MEVLTRRTVGAEQPATAEFLPPNNKKVRWPFGRLLIHPQWLH